MKNFDCIITMMTSSICKCFYAQGDRSYMVPYSHLIVSFTSKCIKIGETLKERFPIYCTQDDLIVIQWLLCASVQSIYGFLFACNSNIDLKMLLHRGKSQRKFSNVLRHRFRNFSSGFDKASRDSYPHLIGICSSKCFLIGENIF